MTSNAFWISVLILCTCSAWSKPQGTFIIFEFRVCIQDQTWRGPLNWSSSTFHFTDEESEALRKYILQFFSDTSQLEKRPRVNVPQKHPLSTFWFIFFSVFFKNVIIWHVLFGNLVIACYSKTFLVILNTLPWDVFNGCLIITFIGVSIQRISYCCTFW